MLRVAEAADDFEDFAPCGEHASAVAFVFVHGAHELDFIVGVVAFAGGGVDFLTSFDLLAPFDAGVVFSGSGASFGVFSAALERSILRGISQRVFLFDRIQFDHNLDSLSVNVV